MAKKTIQLTMFSEGEDLPLFSGTPGQSSRSGGLSTFETHGRQDPLPAFGCRLCLDSGVVDGRLCVCEAGRRVRDEILEAMDEAELEALRRQHRIGPDFRP